MDRFDSLEIFVAAVEEGSLAAAGRRFALSPSMAGKHLTQLEDRLGVRLLKRTTRQLHLTEAGQAYYARCRQLLADLGEADREASDARTTAHGRLRVAAPVTFGALHLGEVAARYLADNPNVQLEISSSERYVDLVSGDFDLAIRIGRLADSDLIVRNLAPCRLVMCAAPAFLAAHGTPKTIDDVRRAPRLAFSEAVSMDAWQLRDRKGKNHVIDAPSAMRSNSTHMLMAAALAGAGIVYAPTFVLGASVARGELVVVLPEYTLPTLQIYAAYVKTRYVTTKVRRFIDLLTQAFGKTPAWDRALPRRS